MSNEITKIILLDTLGTLFCENNCSPESRQKITDGEGARRQNWFHLANSCALNPMYYEQVKLASKVIQENCNRRTKSIIRVCLTSFGHKESCIVAAKIAEVVLVAPYVRRLNSPARENRQVQTATTMIGNNTVLSTLLLDLIPLCLENAQEAFLMLFFPLIVLRNADSPAHPALLLH